MKVEVKRLRNNSVVFLLPKFLGEKIKERLGWSDNESLDFAWEVAKGGYVFRFWRVSDGKCRFRKWGGNYEIYAPNFPIEDEITVVKISKDDSPWLDPTLVVEVRR